AECHPELAKDPRLMRRSQEADPQPALSEAERVVPPQDDSYSLIGSKLSESTTWLYHLQVVTTAQRRAPAIEAGLQFGLRNRWYPVFESRDLPGGKAIGIKR